MAKRERPLTAKQLEKLERITQAHEELRQLFKAWLEEEYQGNPEIPNRAADLVYREVNRLDKEIDAGKLATIPERFEKAKELALAAALPKKRVTYLRTLDALQDLLTLSRAWYKAGPRSAQEQAQELHHLRRLLLEIAAGHLEDLATRFQQAKQAPAEVASRPDVQG